MHYSILCDFFCQGLSKPAVRFVDHEDLKATLLPSIQKALLRNPENILPGIPYILQNRYMCIILFTFFIIFSSF